MSWHPIIRHRSRAMVRRERRSGAARPIPTPRSGDALPVEPGALPIVVDARTHIAVSGPSVPSRSRAGGPDTATPHPQTATGRAETPTPARPAAPHRPTSRSAA